MNRIALFERSLECQPNAFQPDSDSWDYHYHRIISNLQGSEEEKEAIIRKRILRYFGQFKLDSENYLAIRNDVDYHTPGLRLIPNRLVMYGIDYMSIERGKNYYQGFITHIKRMDDSHFMVQFRNQNQCLAAVNRYQRQNKIFLNHEQMHASSSNGWIKMKPYHQFIFQRKVMVRFSTNFDSNDNLSGSTKKSCNLAYSQAKKRFMKSLKQDAILEQQRRKRINRERSQSRSRDKISNNCNIYQLDKDRDHRGRPIRICKCKINHENRKYQRSRSRSRDFSAERYQNLKILEQQKIKEANFKFELYIKRRDNAKKGNSFQNTINLDPANRAMASIHPHTNKMIEQKQKQICIDGLDLEMQIIGGEKAVSKSKQNFNSTQSQEIDFETFLQKLKLQDSKNEYSSFDFDQICMEKERVN